jgi:glycosyltransferase involved in cell wall biosynthesis
MRICYLCADRGISLTKFNGAYAHFRSLVRTFVSLGHEVVVVTPSLEGGDDLRVPIVRIPTPVIAQTLLDAAAEDQTSPERWSKRRTAQALAHVWNNVLVEQTMTETITRYRPDLVFEVYSPYGVAGVLIARRMGVRHLLNVHAPLAWEGAQYRNQALQEAAESLERLTLQFAPLIVANSKETREELIRIGAAPDRSHVVPNGVDEEMFAPEGPVYTDGLEGQFVVGFVGSHKPWHGLEVLVEAFRELAAEPRFHLLVVGAGPMAKLFRSLEQELPGRLTCIDAVPHPDIPKFVRAMDVAVAPYPRLERFYFSPLKALEYMAAGRAVVVSQIGQLTELIEDGHTGLLVPPGDRAALVEAIRRLAADHGLRQRLGRAAAAKIKANYTWRQRASEILALVNSTTG